MRVSIIPYENYQHLVSPPSSLLVVGLKLFRVPSIPNLIQILDRKNPTRSQTKKIQKDTYCIECKPTNLFADCFFQVSGYLWQVMVINPRKSSISGKSASGLNYCWWLKSGYITSWGKGSLSSHDLQGFHTFQLVLSRISAINSMISHSSKGTIGFPPKGDGRSPKMFWCQWPCRLRWASLTLSVWPRRTFFAAIGLWLDFFRLVRHPRVTAMSSDVSTKKYPWPWATGGHSLSSRCKHGNFMAVSDSIVGFIPQAGCFFFFH